MTSLQIIPPILELHDATCLGNTKTTVLVKNPESRIRTVRFRPPKTKYFSVFNLPQSQKLSPGLELAVEIIFHGELLASSDIREQVQDKLVIQSDNGNYELVLRALLPKPDVRLVGDLMFGLLPLESKASKNFKLVNHGMQAVPFRVEWEKTCNISVEPSSGNVPPASMGHEPHLREPSKVSLCATLTMAELGTASGDVAVTVGDAATGEVRKMTFSATAVSQTFEMLDSTTGALVKEVDFGPHYFGEVLHRSFMIFNNGPIDVKYLITYGSMGEIKVRLGDDKGGANSNDPEDPFADLILATRQKLRSKATNDNPYTFVPLSSVVPAYSKAKVSVEFAPKDVPGTKGFSSQLASPESTTRSFEGLALIEFAGCPPSSRMKLPVKGKGMACGFAASPMCLDFGDVPTYGWADQLVTFSNINPLLPVVFDARKASPYFDIQPNQGLIHGGKEQQVLVRYEPKALGNHSASLGIAVSSKSGFAIQHMALQVRGTSMHVGAKTMPIGGTDKLPSDFTKASKFVGDDQVCVCDMDKYVAAMRERRTAQMKAQISKQVDDSDVNLGLTQHSGLRPFEPHLPKAVDPLWTVGASEDAKPRQQRAVSEAEVEGVPLYKMRPETDQEKAACMRELSKEEINRLVVGPKVMDFGTISVGTSNTCNFMIINTLTTPIHVVLDIKAVKEFKGSKAISQVIPPGARARFPLTLVANDIRTFTEKLEYCINSSHIFPVMVSASVVPVTLELSSDELHFEFSLENWDTYIEKMLILHNPHKFFVDYSITCMPMDVFSASPMVGTVKPQVMPCVDLLPYFEGSGGGLAQGLAREGSLVLSLVGGDHPRRIFLQGVLPESALRLRDKVLDAGSVPLGSILTLTAQLLNSGTRAAAFSVLPNPLLKVQPMRAKASPDEVVDVEVTFCPQSPGLMSTALEIQVQGGKTLKLPVKAEAMVPKVDVLQDQFDFGSVYLGTLGRTPVTLVNTTSVPAKMRVDLLQTPELRLSIAKEAWNPSEYDACPLQAIGSSGHPRHIGRSSTDERRRSITSRHSSSSGFGGFAERGGAKYLITLNAKAELQLQLLYKPETLGSQSWEICFEPVSQDGDSRHVAPPERRVVNGEGVKPRLNVSRASIDFGTRIVIRSNQIKAPYSSDVLLHSNEEEAADVEVGEASTADGAVFKVVPSKLNIKPGSTEEIKVQFCPRDWKTYETRMPVYFGGNKTRPYMMLEIFGQGQHPRLSFDMRECLLPPVPLGMKSWATFHIVNDGYDNLELRFRLPADESHIPISIDFPEGNLIGLAKERLPVVVSFESSKPISFTANIDFMDEEGKRYSIPVTACADNCLLSHQAFLEANAGRLELTAADGASPIVLKPVPVKGEKGGAAAAKYELPSPASALGTTSPPRAIARYLEATTGRSLDKMYSQLLTSRGKLLVELVEALSGKPVPGKVGKLSPNKKDAAGQLLGLFDSILDRWQDVDEHFGTVNQLAWNSVIAQIFKVFVLGRVTLKSFKALPGLTSSDSLIEQQASMSGDPLQPLLPTATNNNPSSNASVVLPPDSALMGSNMYSVAETCLLAWASLHFKREFGSRAARLVNFDTDFHDGLALYSLLAGYWPAYASKKAVLHTGHVLSVPDRHDNAELVVRLLADLGLPYEVSASHIANPDAREMLVLLLYLYQTLPQFVPRTTILFTCRLGEMKTKDLELSNPSKKAIAYTARLQGHSDFSVDASIVHIDAKGTVRFPLKCAPTTSMPQEARLVLMSKQDGGGAHAATLVFLLRSQVNVRAPLKCVKTEGPLYEMQQFEFTVTNPFAADCDFSIQLLHEPADPDAVKAADKKNKGAPKKGSKPGAPSALERQGTLVDDPQLPYPAAFGLDRTRMRLKANVSEKVRATFLPFMLGTHWCTVVFKDKDQGAFVYELVGETTLPAPVMECRGVVPLEGPNHTFDVFLPFSNNQLDVARRTFLDKHPGAKDRSQAALVRADHMKNQTELEYTVSQTNGLISCANSIKLSSNALPPAPPTPDAVVAPGRATDPAPPNCLRLALKPMGTGIYPVRIMLTSMDGLDTRVVDVELTCQIMLQQFDLLFEAPTRQTVTQEIPLLNTGEQTMTVVASLLGPSKAFSGNKEAYVPPGASLPYILTFKPLTQGEHKCTLELSIPATGERNVYTLVGKAADPVAESHIVIECQARKTASRNIAVPNITGSSTTYEVMCDLDCISGPETVNVSSSQASSYKLIAAPVRSGLLLGSLNFKAPDGQYVWFSVEVRASEAPEVGAIDVEAEVRTAVVISIPVINPLDIPLKLAVHYGHNALVGPNMLELPSRSTASEGGNGGKGKAELDFYYAPLLPGSAQTSVVLTSKELGEFVYHVNMTAKATPPITLEPLSVELGSKKSKVLEIPNPMPFPAHVSALCTEGSSPSFSVSPSSLTIPAQGQQKVSITYAPALIQEGPEPATITLRSDDIGQWEYNIEGDGSGRSQGSHAASLAAAAAAAASSEVPVDVGGVLQVPIAFMPDSLQAAEAQLSISVAPAAAGPEGTQGEPMVWRYNIKGISEAEQPQQGSTFKFKCKARSQVEERMEVTLSGLHSVSPDEVFTHEVVQAPPSAPTSSLAAAQPIPGPDGSPPARITNPSHSPTLAYSVLFAPPRAMSTSVQLIIYKPSGGRWRFEVQLQATDNDVDGDIEIEAAMDHTTSVPLVLHAPYSATEPVPYRAWFSSDTPLSFNVKPAQGWLPLRPTVSQGQQSKELESTRSMHGRSRYVHMFLQCVPLKPTAFQAHQPKEVESTHSVDARGRYVHMLLVLAPFCHGLSTACIRRACARGGAGSSSLGSLRKDEAQPATSAPLHVSYTCRDFGKIVRGRLFVCAGDVQYSYNLVGRMPSYVPPRPEDFEATVDSRLSPEMSARLEHAAGKSTSRVNYVAQNARQRRQQHRR
ncbi:flagellar associated protein [Dunaliella salina]|uniref:Flagellar associated protein n=1 Tax=Dunaliella salina TaxID=3046 RepID=A0ABQ7GII1_DUNSA|nr:flagellar associated protein [Dunaliella salina]|eukprot:KAF5834411.1 flagellar associated protein [Dunaliella salina]